MVQAAVGVPLAVVVRGHKKAGFIGDLMMQSRALPYVAVREASEAFTAAEVASIVAASPAGTTPKRPAATTAAVSDTPVLLDANGGQFLTRGRLNVLYRPVGALWVLVVVPAGGNAFTAVRLLERAVAAVSSTASGAKVPSPADVEKKYGDLLASLQAALAAAGPAGAAALAAAEAPPLPLSWPQVRADAAERSATLDALYSASFPISPSMVSLPPGGAGVAGDGGQVLTTAALERLGRGGGGASAAPSRRGPLSTAESAAPGDFFGLFGPPAAGGGGATGPPSPPGSLHASTSVVTRQSSSRPTGGNPPRPAPLVSTPSVTPDWVSFGNVAEFMGAKPGSAAPHTGPAPPGPPPQGRSAPPPVAPPRPPVAPVAAAPPPSSWRLTETLRLEARGNRVVKAGVQGKVDITAAVASATGVAKFKVAAASTAGLRHLHVSKSRVRPAEMGRWAAGLGGLRPGVPTPLAYYALSARGRPMPLLVGVAVKPGPGGEIAAVMVTCAIPPGPGRRTVESVIIEVLLPRAGGMPGSVPPSIVRTSPRAEWAPSARLLRWRLPRIAQGPPVRLRAVLQHCPPPGGPGAMHGITAHVRFGWTGATLSGLYLQGEGTVVHDNAGDYTIYV